MVMLSRRNGRFTQQILSALAALVAAAVPLVASDAYAETPKKDDSAASADKAPSKEKHAKKHASKAKAHKHEALSKPVEDTSATKEKSTAKGSKKGSKKTTAARASSGPKKKAAAPKKDASAPQRPCFGQSITLDRGGLEAQKLSLVDCRGKELETSRGKVSILLRPWGAPKPDKLVIDDDKPSKKHGGDHGHGHEHGAKTPGLRPGEVAPSVKLVDPGVLTRVDAIARKFPGKAISIVSGYRPQSRGSMHQTARAVDLHVVGVNNEELVAFCKTLVDTGCGYYPNSSFVHVDVRNPGTGSVTWIDASGPGETPRYVTTWPPPAADKTAPEEQTGSNQGDPHDDVATPEDADADAVYGAKI
jgi:hypothetical protein